MRKDKRGISPLIATVILVGVVVATAALLWIFLSKQVTLLGEKQGAKCSAQQAAEIEYKVSKCKIAGAATALTIKNTGKVAITGFRVRIGSGKTSTIEQEIRVGEEKTANLKGTGDVTLFPVVVKDGKLITCSERIVKASCS